MSIEIVGQLGRSINAVTKKTVKTQLPGTIRKKNPGTGYSGTGSILNALRQGRSSLGSISSPDDSVGTKTAQSLTGSIRKVIKQTVEGTAPISTNSGKVEDSPVSVPAVYDTGGVLESLKSGLKTYAPAIMVIGAVVLLIVAIRSSGNSGGRRR